VLDIRVYYSIRPNRIYIAHPLYRLLQITETNKAEMECDAAGKLPRNTAAWYGTSISVPFATWSLVEIRHPYTTSTAGDNFRQINSELGTEEREVMLKH
jgi:hypothetical protein